MSLIASIDCGTTSTRFIVFNEKADVLAVEQQEFKQIYEKPGWHAQDPDAMVSSCLSCIDKAVTKLEESGKGKASDIAAIGITNQRETTVVWSRKTGKALCDAIAWPDTRTTHTVRQLAGKSDKGADALKHITGLPLSTYFAGVKLRWLLDNNEAVRKAHDEGDLMFGTVDTWLLYRFTGGVDGGLFLTDCVNASRTMLMDIRKLEWSDECLEYFGFDKRILATIVSNSEVYGELAADCKLKGVKIAGMIGDQQGAMTGQKCFRKGETKNTYGTGCFMLFNTGEEVVPSSHGLLTTVAYKAGKDAKPVYALEGSIAVAGSAIQWVRDKLELIKSAPEIGELASQVEDTGGVYFVTGFSGLFAPYWDDTATGCMIGISAFTNKCHIARATIESVCFQTKAILDAMGADSGAELTALRVDGGMTNSDVAMQIQADIIGLTVDRPKMRESTALGSAIMAGHAIGFHDWDVAQPESLDAVNTAGLDEFKPTNSDEDRAKRYAGWNRAVLRSKAWKESE